MTPTSSHDHPLLREAAEWDHAVKDLVGPAAALMAVSQWIPDARVYRRANRIYKLRRRHAHAPLGTSSLTREATVMRRLGIDADLVTDDHWEVLNMPEAAGEPAAIALRGATVGRRVRALLAIARETHRLHRLGVAHRDLRLDNILFTSSGVTLIDFDRAMLESELASTWRDFAGVGGLGAPYPIWKTAISLLSPRLVTLARRGRQLVAPARWDASGENETVRLLAEAWTMAATAPANAAGQGLAYYALTFQGWHFPGERPWYLRWEAIRRSVDFEGKRIVELGCNLGLHSSFAIVYGAESATGVDVDPAVLEAANMVAVAFGVSPRFFQADLDADADWERRAGSGDMVIAMSLLNWIRDRERLMRYLGTFAEVVYEGHEATAVEMGRLRAAGFGDIREIVRTERGRSVLHGRRVG